MQCKRKSDCNFKFNIAHAKMSKLMLAPLELAHT